MNLSNAAALVLLVPPPRYGRSASVLNPHTVCKRGCHRPDPPEAYLFISYRIRRPFSVRSGSNS
jgi:hypothetical protein